ncbi:MAG: hypothetical protein AB8F74_08200 [Saprospiraceae bacterium]
MKKVNWLLILALISSALLFIGCPSNKGTQSNSAESSTEAAPLFNVEESQDEEIEEELPYSEETEFSDDYEDEEMELDSLDETEKDTEDI